MDFLTRTLFDLTPAGAMLLRPLCDAARQLIDFAYEQLNLAGQYMLRLPAQPTQTFLQLYPMATASGVFAFYRDTFLSGQPDFYGVDYRYDGLDAYYQLAAHRAGELLVVTFTDTADRRQGDMAAALQRSRQAEQQALAEAERQHQQLQALIDQAPVAIGYFEGPALVVTAANPLLSAMWGRQQADVVGRPLLDGVPELRGQSFADLIHQVRETGHPFAGTEAPATMLRDGQLTTTYYNFVYQPLYDAQGAVLGVMDVAVEVTEQVLARQQVQQLNEELAAINEELRASNEEYLATNFTLSAAQLQLQQLNEELETRVRERTTQVQEQQELLRQILKSVPAAIATLRGPKHHFAFANARYQYLVGNRATVGQTVAEALPEVREQGVIELLDRVYATGEPFLGREIVLMLEQPPGPPHQYHYDLTYLPLRDGQDQVQGILVFAIDVTEAVRTRRQATALQAELLASVRRQAQERQNLYQVFEQTPAAIVLLREPSHTIDYYNPAFAATFPPEGYAADALRGHSLAEVYPRMQAAGLIALLDRVFETGEPQVVTEMPLAKLHPGSPRFVTFAYQAYREQGHIVGVAAFIYDATEQVLARQQVQQLSAQREEQRAELQRLFEQAPMAIVVLRGPRFIIELANKRAQAIWGRTAAETVGRPHFEALPDAAGQGYEELLTGVLESGEPLVMHEVIVELERTHLGLPNTGYYTIIFQPLRDGHQQVSGIAVMWTEVTDQVHARQQVLQLNQELHTTNTQLTRTNADLDAFVYTASHDLRSPIANIEGLVAALRHELADLQLHEPTLDHLLHLVDTSIARFQTTISHLTAIMNLQQTDQLLSAEAIDLAALVQDVCLDLAPAIEQSQAQVQVEVAECPVLHFSPKDLRSIVFNLLSNAIKYRAPERRPVVQLHATCHGHWLTLRVQDNGLGLSPDEQTELFGLFRRLHTHVEGSGVGLYSIKKLITNAGGTIAVESQPGVGSTFVVRLPLASTSLSPSAKSLTAISPPASPPPEDGSVMQAG